MSFKYSKSKGTVDLLHPDKSKNHSARSESNKSNNVSNKSNNESNNSKNNSKYHSAKSGSNKVNVDVRDEIEIRLYKSEANKSQNNENQKSRKSRKSPKETNIQKIQKIQKIPKIQSFKFGFEFEALVGIRMDKTLDIMLKRFMERITKVLEERARDPNMKKSKDSEFVCANVLEILERRLRIITLQNRNHENSIQKSEKERAKIIMDFAFKYMYVMLLNSSGDQQFLFAPEYRNDLKCLPSPFTTIDTCSNPDNNCWTVTQDVSVEIDGKDLYTMNHYAMQRVKNVEGRSRLLLLENIEIVSPILKWNDINRKENNSSGKLSSFENVLEKKVHADGLFEYYNNELTSNHIHISLMDTFKNPYNLVDICMAWLYFEPLWFSLVAPFRENNDYCNSMENVLYYVLEDALEKENKNTDEILTLEIAIFEKMSSQNLESMMMDLEPIINKDGKIDSLLDKIIALFQGLDFRYTALNLLNVSKVGTIEVRLKHGSTDATENIMWMKLLAFFVYATMKNESVTTIDLFQGDKRKLSLKELSKLLTFHATSRKPKELFEYFEIFIQRGVRWEDIKIKDDASDCLQFWKEKLVQEEKGRNSFKYLTREYIKKINYDNFLYFYKAAFTPIGVLMKYGKRICYGK